MLILAKGVGAADRPQYRQVDISTGADIGDAQVDVIEESSMVLRAHVMAPMNWKREALRCVAVLPLRKCRQLDVHGSADPSNQRKSFASETSDIATAPRLTGRSGE